MRASALAVMLLVLTGVAFAAPVSVLRIDPGGVLVPLPEDGRYDYSYQQSIYQVPVIEEHERLADGVRIVRVRSSDLRAVEYFRWDGPIRSDDGRYVQDAPPNRVAALVIRVTHEGTQHVRAGSTDISLRDRFGEVVVTVTPAYVARAALLVGAAR